MSENHDMKNVPESGPVNQRQMSRRSLLGMGVALGAGAVGLATGNASAAAHMHGDHENVGAEKEMSMVDVAAKCIAMGEKCHALGLKVLSTGDASMADCNRAVSVMLAVCHAVARMAALQSERLPDIVNVALHTCDDCRIECEKHADHHPECKACGEACAKMVEAMKQPSLARQKV